MDRLPRYRTGDAALDAQVADLVRSAGGTQHADLVFELIASALRLGRESDARLDLKIANAALKEMRYSFQVFAPYRGERKVSIFGSARTRAEDPHYVLARDFARAMAERDWMVLTGAGPGIMTAGIEGAGAAHSFGINIRLPFEAVPSEYIAADPKLINFRYFFTRKLTFMKESHGFVLLPGGFGTLDEAFELLTLVQTGKTDPTPIVLLQAPSEDYWDAWLRFVDDELLAAEMIVPEDRRLVRITSDIDEAVDEITGFYSNYHSARFVRGLLVLRMRELPAPDVLAEINEAFADIVVKGGIEPVDPTDVEVASGDRLDLARLGLRFDRTHWSRLRMLLDVVNGRSPAAEPPQSASSVSDKAS